VIILDKVAICKEVIYKQAGIDKTASRAWKKAIGELSEVSRNRLISSGILNHEKELAGLKKGTDNIIKATNSVLDTSRNGKIYMKESMKRILSDPAAIKQFNIVQKPKSLKEFIHNLITKLMLKAQVQGMHKLNKGFVSVSNGGQATKNIVSHGDVFRRRGFLEKQYFNSSLATDPVETLVNDISKKDKFDRQYANAILSRHEADEIRAANGAIKKKRYTFVGNNKMPTTRYFSHLSPKVLGMESANVAVAPDKVRDAIKKVRQKSGESITLGTQGFNYGKSGVYDKSKLEQIEKTQHKFTKSLMNSQLNN
jgi:hypothetical protein